MVIRGNSGFCKYGETALYQSTRRGTFLAAEVLIRRGAEVNTQSEGVTPLHLASLNGMASVVTLLLQKGANPNARDAMGKTGLGKAGSTARITERKYRHF